MLANFDPFPEPGMAGQRIPESGGEGKGQFGFS
jgi:hypothetical protein